MSGQAIRFKRIVGGTAYNTQTATWLGALDRPGHSREHLFKTRSKGTYFVYVDRWSVPEEAIEPITPEAARAWMEKHCSTDQLRAEFASAETSSGPEARFTMRMPQSLHRRVAAIADSRKQSLTAWIVQCLEQAADEVGRLTESKREKVAAARPPKTRRGAAPNS